jgi:hypothetical protein
MRLTSRILLAMASPLSLHEPSLHLNTASFC